MRANDFELMIKKNRIREKFFYPSENYNRHRGIVILCHGIPGGKKDPGDPGYALLAQILSEDGWQAVTFNFRGAGESTGDFDLRGWAEDLKAVKGYFISLDTGASPVVLFGFSAGAAVAVYACAQDSKRIAGLILCGCPADFDSILKKRGINQYLNHCRQIGIIKTPGFPFDQSTWIESFRLLRPENWVSKIITKPKLIIHGDQDDVVPVEHAYRLYEKALDPKELIIIKNGGHRLRLNETAMNSAREWLKNFI
ncbi:MAG TPA: alpha/beta hydrolase [Thermodesulfobacteriota bacterium]|nr:alpha/beta hydrolase [Thermodesulfobacteriota bacterium]